MGAKQAVIKRREPLVAPIRVLTVVPKQRNWAITVYSTNEVPMSVWLVNLMQTVPDGLRNTVNYRVELLLRTNSRVYFLLVTTGLGILLNNLFVTRNWNHQKSNITLLIKVLLVEVMIPTLSDLYRANHMPKRQDGIIAT
jgi:hypothetical protein